MIIPVVIRGRYNQPNPIPPGRMNRIINWLKRSFIPIILPPQETQVSACRDAECMGTDNVDTQVFGDLENLIDALLRGVGGVGDNVFVESEPVDICAGYHEGFTIKCETVSGFLGGLASG